MWTTHPKRLARIALVLTTFTLALTSEIGNAHEPAIYWLAQADDWGDLSEPEQHALRAHRGEWRQYSPQQRQRLRGGVQRYQTLSPDERRDVIRGRERFQSLQPQEREHLRERYQKSHRGKDEKDDD